MKTLLFLALTFVTPTLLSSCRTSPTGSDPANTGQPDPVSSEPSVTLTLQLSASQGSPDHPITASGTAQNQGPEAVYYLAGCGDNTFVYYEVLGPDAKPVHIYDPTAPRPLCPEDETKLSPGQDVQTSLEFSGILYSDEGVRLAAPAGHYTLVARFTAWNPVEHSEEFTLETRESFLWSS